LYRHGLFGLLTHVALVAKANLYRLARNLLYLAAGFADLCPLLFTSRSDDHAQQVTQRIYDDVGLAHLASFGSVIARPMPAPGRAL
jgi:hypothetical protein